MPKRILIADDSKVVLQAVRASLESNPDWEVCGEAVDGQQAVAKATQLHPDLIILDLAMPRMNGLSAAREIHTVMPSVPIVLHTLYRSEIGLTGMTDGICRIVDKTETGALLSAVNDLLSAEVTSQPGISDETQEILVPPVATPTPNVAVAAAPAVQNNAVEEPKTSTQPNPIKAA